MLTVANWTQGTAEADGTVICNYLVKSSILTLAQDEKLGAQQR